ncbi:MAG: carbohydrate ABC transporter permease [Chloroflexota bacterium]|nr:carbohydrate ABC transporter permease [Chloroflexota bacterium]
MLWPLLWTLLTALKHPQEVNRIPMTWLPDNWLYFENFKTLFSEYPIDRWLLNSVIVTTLSVISSLFFASLAGYAFAKLRFKGKELLFLSVIALLMMPPEITVVPLYLMFNSVGLTNTYPGIVGSNWMTVLGVFIMRQFMEGIPDDYIDAARVDGAREFTIFLRVALPLTIPGFVTVAVLKTILAWNDFLWPLVMASSQEMMTITVGLQVFSTAFYVEHTLVAAGALVSMLPLLIMFIFMQRWVMQSMVMVGIKG